MPKRIEDGMPLGEMYEAVFGEPPPAREEPPLTDADIQRRRAAAEATGVERRRGRSFVFSNNPLARK